MKLLFAGILFVAIMLVVTPIGSIVGGRLSESDAGAPAPASMPRHGPERSSSPILGWGGPRPSINPFSPSIGTHGHVWFAMFSHGFVGLGLYVSWMVWAMYRAVHRHDPVSIALASVVFVAALQMFFYNMFPAPLPIVLIAIGLLFRDDERGTARPPTAIAVSESPTAPSMRSV